MIERLPNRSLNEQKIAYATGIVETFPGLKDPGSKHEFVKIFNLNRNQIAKYIA